MGWDTDITKPKSDAGDREVALDDLTVEILKKRRARQNKARVAAGEDWIDADLVFTASGGSPLHPACVTGQFKELILEADLPRSACTTCALCRDPHARRRRRYQGRPGHAAVNAAAALMAGTGVIGGV